MGRSNLYAGGNGVKDRIKEAKIAVITLKGAEVSAKIREQVDELCKGMTGSTPKLAIVRVGERPDDLSYERGALNGNFQRSMKILRFRESCCFAPCLSRSGKKISRK